MRQGDVARATAMARAALDAQPSNAAAARGLAATRIAAGQYAEALAALDAADIGEPTMPTRDFLVIHALYAASSADRRQVRRPSGRERLQAVGRATSPPAAAHAALVTEWLAVVAARSAPTPR